MRNRLLITTNGGGVEQYDLATQTLLAPLSVGTLAGADLSNDGSILYATEATKPGRLQKVDLNTGVTTIDPFTPAVGETGGYDFKRAANGRAFATSSGAAAPLKQIDIATGTITNRPGITVSPNTAIHRSADGSLLFFTEGGSDSGVIFTYDSGTDTFSPERSTGLALAGALSAVNRDGSLIAIQVGGTISIMDRNLKGLHILSGLAGGLVFDSNSDLLYALTTTTSEVVAFDTNTWRERWRLPVGQTITTGSPLGNGGMAVSEDSSQIFIATSTGVRVVHAPAHTGVAAGLSFASAFPRFIAAGSAGALTVTVKDPAGYVVTGYTGTIHFTSTYSPALLPTDYTFTAADAGTHTFSLTLKISAIQAITVTDTVRGLSVTQSGISVQPSTFINFIPVTDHRDLVFDPLRKQLIVTTSSGNIERFDTTAGALLAPIQTGGLLLGADLTQDGSNLLVADGTRGATAGFFHRLDLTSGIVQDIPYPIGAGNDGSAFDVAIGANGIALGNESSGSFGASVTLQQINAADGAIIPSPLGSIRERGTIARSADGSTVLLGGGSLNGVVGPVQLYDANSGKIIASGLISGYFGAVSRNGALVAFGDGSTAYLMDRSLHVLHAFSGITAGVAFSPTRDVLFAATDTQVILYDTNTWKELLRVNIGESSQYNNSPFNDGLLQPSSDGGTLFVTTPSGIRVFDVAAPTITSATLGTDVGGKGHPAVSLSFTFSEQVAFTGQNASAAVWLTDTRTAAILTPTSVTLDAAGKTLRIFLDNPVPDGNYRFTIGPVPSSPTGPAYFIDRVGNRLDGNGDGVPGGDYQFDFLPSTPALSIAPMATSGYTTRLSLPAYTGTLPIDGLRIQRSNDGGIGFTTIATLSAATTTFDDDGLTPTTSYFYRIQKFRGSSFNSAWSPSVAVTTLTPGDSNGDYAIDVNDIRQIMVSGHYSDGTSPHTWTEGDFNHDGFVDAADLRMLQSHLNGNVFITLRRASTDPGEAEVTYNGGSSTLVPIPTTGTFPFTGGSSDDTLTLDFSNGNPLAASGLIFDGGAGINTVAIISTTGDDTLTANDTGLTFTGGTFSNIAITTANVQSLQFHGGSGGNDSINLTGGTYTLDADTPTGTPNVSVTVGPTAIANFATDQHLANLTLNGGVANLSNTRHSMYVNGLAISNNGLLDIANSFLYLNNAVTSFATVKTYLDAAYNLHGLGNANAPYAGDYKGVMGITSSVARTSYASDEVVGIGYYDGSLQDPTNPDTVGQIYGPNSDSGHGTGIALNQILIRPTLTGDFNGDGVVNSYDVSLLNTYGLFNNGPTLLGWQVGDLNGDGVVNFKDVTVFNTVGNFNQPPFPVPVAAVKVATMSLAVPSVSVGGGKTAAATAKPQAARHHSVRKVGHGKVAARIARVIGAMRRV